MQVDFQHGVYRARPVVFGDMTATDAQLYASMAASLDAFTNSLHQAAAGDRQSVLASAIASLQASAGHAAEAAYNQAKAGGASESDAKAAAQSVSQAYQAQQAAYFKAANDLATQAEATEAANISAKANQARLLLNQGFNLNPYPDPEPPGHTGLLTVLAVGAAAFFALKG